MFNRAPLLYDRVASKGLYFDSASLQERRMPLTPECYKEVCEAMLVTHYSLLDHVSYSDLFQNEISCGF